MWRVTAYALVSTMKTNDFMLGNNTNGDGFEVLCPSCTFTGNNVPPAGTGGNVQDVPKTVSELINFW